MPLKILVADDEKEARELLLHYLHPYQSSVEIMECADGQATHLALQQFSPDIVFLSECANVF